MQHIRNKDEVLIAQLHTASTALACNSRIVLAHSTNIPVLAKVGGFLSLSLMTFPIKPALI